MAYRKKPPEEKIADLQKRKAQIDAQLRRERSRAKEEQRRQDTRRKIIAGAIALEHKDPHFRDTMKRLIDELVTRTEDRALFGLDPLPETGASQSIASSSDTNSGLLNRLRSR